MVKNLFRFSLILTFFSLFLVFNIQDVQSEEYIVTPILLSDDSNPNSTSDRTSNTNLPDYMSFGFTFNSEVLIFRLRRSRLLPTVTSNFWTTIMANFNNRNSAVYTDLEHGSALMVKKEAEHLFKLDGSFYHSNTEWTMKPTTDVDKTKIRHLVVPMETDNITITLAGDQVYESENRVKRSFEKKINDQVEHHRHKRAVTQHVVEIAFIVDHADYQKWVNYVGTANALSEMRLWYTYMAETINIRYQTINDPVIAISTTTTILKILTNDADDAFIEDITDASGIFDGTTGLNQLIDWYPTQADIPDSDHYMLFTGFDISGSSGIARRGVTCKINSVSITENARTGITAAIAAHEVGHSLSAIHDKDTTGPNACTDADQYVMATIFQLPVQTGNEGNPWRFSPCSIEAFKNYLSSQTCTLPEETLVVDALPPPAPGREAGVVLSRDDQCKLKFRDPDSNYCNFGNEAAICGNMFCRIPGTGGSCTSQFPLEFTSCGTDKWCVAGKCVDIVQDTTTTSTTTTPTTTTTTPTTTTTTSTTTTTTPTTTTTTPTTTTTTPTTTTTTPTTTTTTPTTTTTTPTTTTTTPTTTTTTPTTTTTTPTTTTTTPTTTTTTPTTTTTTPTTTTTTPTTTTTTTTTTIPTTTTTTPTTTTTTTTTTTPTTTTTTPTTTTTTTPTTTTTTPTTTTTTTTTTTPTTTTTLTSTAPTITTPKDPRLEPTTPQTLTTLFPGGPSTLNDCFHYLNQPDLTEWQNCMLSVLNCRREQIIRGCGHI